MPAFGMPMSISVSPVWGRIFWKPTERIASDAEQSYMPSVFIINLVGIPALAEEIFGE